jgi:ubiquinone/menaquinone biosynthesis C-methylase UbiE
MYMPVNIHDTTDTALSQRKLYSGSFLTKAYWDYKNRIIAQMLPSSLENILDLGCGEGIQLQHLQRNFPKTFVFGIDYLQENVVICKEHSLNCTRGDVYNLSLPDNAIDAIVFIEVIEHLAEPQKAIVELYRVLKPNGLLVIGFPNDRFFLFARLLLLKFREARYDPGHLKLWSPREMQTVLENCGFFCMKTKCIPFGMWPLSLHGIILAQKQ